MAFKIKLTDQAQLEIWEIFEWYESREAGLGLRFDTEVNEMIYSIARKPTVFTFYDKDFRRALLKNFPYLIIFKVTENEIIVYSVVYGGRNPALITRKIN